MSSSAEMMALVRELKALNKRKKAGEALNDHDKQRRRELKRVLRAQLEMQKSQEGSPVTPSLVSQAAEPVVPASVPQHPPVVTASGAQQQVARIDVQRTASKQSTPPVRVEPATPSRPGAPTPAERERYKKNLRISLGGQDVVEESPPAAAPTRAPPRKGPRASGGDVLGIKWEARHNEKHQIQSMFHLADEALNAQQTRERVSAPEDVEAQLQAIASGYTDVADAVTDDEYYSGYFDEGFGYAATSPEDLNVIDPREIELHKVGLAFVSEDGTMNVVVPAGLAFLDDFGALYEARVLPPPGEEVEADEDDPNLLVRGRRRVTVHMLDGRVKRGAIAKLNRGAPGFTLLPTSTGRSEDISMGQVKALFVHQPPKGAPATSPGRALTVTFADRRSVQGSTDDYQPGEQVFSLVPTGKMGTQYERIVINAAAVAAIR